MERVPRYLNRNGDCESKRVVERQFQEDYERGIQDGSIDLFETSLEDYVSGVQMKYYNQEQLTNIISRILREVGKWQEPTK